MHRLLAPEHRAEPRRRQRPRHRNVPVAKQPRLFRETTIRRLHQQRAPASRQPFPCLLEACDRGAGTAREPKQFDDPVFQNSDHPVGKPVGYRQSPFRRAGENTALQSGFYHIAARTQPHAATGQGCKHIEYQGAVGAGYEAQQGVARMPLARHQAAAQRARPVRRVVCLGFGDIGRGFSQRCLPLRTNARGRP